MVSAGSIEDHLDAAMRSRESGRVSDARAHFEAVLALDEVIRGRPEISASPCNCSAEAMHEGRARQLDRDYSLERFAQSGEKVEKMMRQIALLCAAISMGIFVSPASAQQAPPEQATPPAQQTGPNEPASPTGQSMPEEAQPPSTSQEEPPPPPFPPMPRARPTHRWVDLGGEHRSRAHHQSARSKRQSARSHHQHSAKRSRAAQPTSRMTRRCLSMSVRQAMKQPTCRSLMRDNLHANEARHHPSAHRHNAASAARRHSSAHRHSAVDHRHKHHSKRRRT